MDQATGKAVMNDGKPVTAKTEFEAEGEKGSGEVAFSANLVT